MRGSICWRWHPAIPTSAFENQRTLSIEGKGSEPVLTTEKTLWQATVDQARVTHQISCPTGGPFFIVQLMQAIETLLDNFQLRADKQL